MKITDGRYDQSLAVKCVNGTFVGQKVENIISYKGIPFVGQQPVGNLRWKAPSTLRPTTASMRPITMAKPPSRSRATPLPNMAPARTAST